MLGLMFCCHHLEYVTFLNKRPHVLICTGHPANYIGGSCSWRKVKLIYKNETGKTALFRRAFVLRGWNLGASEYR